MKAEFKIARVTWEDTNNNAPYPWLVSLGWLVYEDGELIVLANQAFEPGVVEILRIPQESVKEKSILEPGLTENAAHAQSYIPGAAGPIIRPQYENCPNELLEGIKRDVQDG